MGEGMTMARTTKRASKGGGRKPSSTRVRNRKPRKPRKPTLEECVQDFMRSAPDADIAEVEYEMALLLKEEC